MAHLKRSLYAIPAVGLSFVLALGSCPVPAIAATSAELQTQLEAATKQLNTLGAAAEQAGNDLATVTPKLEDTSAKIEQTQSDIETRSKSSSRPIKASSAFSFPISTRRAVRA